jgi:plastocyanin
MKAPDDLLVPKRRRLPAFGPRSARLPLLIPALPALLLAAAACFSERSQTTGPSGSCTAALDPSQYGSTVIAASGFSFNPVTVRTTVGGKVTWLNCEPAGTPAHTTTADGGAWGSSPLDPGMTYTFTFSTPGTYEYHCEPHPFMTATVEVLP